MTTFGCLKYLSVNGYMNQVTVMTKSLFMNDFKSRFSSHSKSISKYQVHNFLKKYNQTARFILLI